MDIEMLFRIPGIFINVKKAMHQDLHIRSQVSNLENIDYYQNSVLQETAIGHQAENEAIKKIGSKDTKIRLVELKKRARSETKNLIFKYMYIQE